MMWKGSGKVVKSLTTYTYPSKPTPNPTQEGKLWWMMMDEVEGY